MTIAGRNTSISLEEPFWTSLKEIAASRDMPASKLVAQIDTDLGSHFSNLSSAIRVYVLRYYWFSTAIPSSRRLPRSRPSQPA